MPEKFNHEDNAGQEPVANVNNEGQSWTTFDLLCGVQLLDWSVFGNNFFKVTRHKQSVAHNWQVNGETMDCGAHSSHRVKQYN